MKFTYLKYIVLSIFLSLGLVACLDSDEVDLGTGPMVVEFTSQSTTVNFPKQEGGPTQDYSVSLSLIGAKNTPINTDVVVEVGVASDSEAKEGVDFEFTNGTTVTIPAGEMTAELPISISKEVADPLNPKTLTLEIVSSTEPILISDSETIDIKLQAVCELKLASFVGTYTVTDVGSGSEYEVQVTTDGEVLFIDGIGFGGGLVVKLTGTPVEPTVEFPSQDYDIPNYPNHPTYGNIYGVTEDVELSSYNTCDNSMYLDFRLCTESGTCFSNEMQFELVKN